MTEPCPPLPGFEIHGELGRGTTGVVYDAIHTPLNRRIALKVPFLPESERARRVSRFLREAQALAYLSGRSPARIPTLHMVGEFANQPFYVRELVEGDTLEAKAATWAISLAAALAIIAQVARMVEWVHQQGFVHRNVSAANVLLDSDGHPWLIGFGRVRLISGAQPIPIDDVGTTSNVDVQGLRELLRSICAALGHRVPDDLEQAITSGALMTAEAFAAAVEHCVARL